MFSIIPLLLLVALLFASGTLGLVLAAFLNLSLSFGLTSFYWTTQTYEFEVPAE